jgi:O-antigen/teichoic acid export membrane protein
MSSALRGLAGETVIYGASTMIGRLLNWLLMPFYIRVLTTEEYGVIINLYSLISLLLVVFTYGLETGYFRFARKGNQQSVFKTSVITLAYTSTFLIFLMFLFSSSFSKFWYDGMHQESLILMGLIVAFDSFLSIPFANLRLNNRAFRFAYIKIISIGLNIFLNIFFLVFIPFLIRNNHISLTLSGLYQSGSGVFYVLLSNCISSVSILLLFLVDFKAIKGVFDFNVLKDLLRYSWPVLIVGIAGMITQNSDKILIPYLIHSNGFQELAIYGANFKIGVLMSLFTQSFRFAFEPYFFKNQEKGVHSYAKIMDYFIFFGIFIFLGVTIFIDVLNLLLTSVYLRGNIIIPVVLLAQLFYGIYFNLSLWYKLTDKTIYGAIFGVFGTAVTLGLNFILIPSIGIMGGALAMLTGYFVIMLLSYSFGQKHYPVPYPLKRIGFYFLIGAAIYLVDQFVKIDILFYRFLFKGFIFVCFVFCFLSIQKIITLNSLFKWLKLK